MKADLFCGRCNSATPHNITVYSDHVHFIATCDVEGCDGFVKFVATSHEGVSEWIEAYNASNKPAVTTDELDANAEAMQSILDSFND